MLQAREILCNSTDSSSGISMTFLLSSSNIIYPEDQSVRKFSGKCSNCTIRGDAWISPDRQISTISRLVVSGDSKSNYIGFRLVKDPGTNIQYSDTLKADTSPPASPNVTSIGLLSKPAVVLETGKTFTSPETQKPRNDNCEKQIKKEGVSSW